MWSSTPHVDSIVIVPNVKHSHREFDPSWMESESQNNVAWTQPEMRNTERRSLWRRAGVSAGISAGIGAEISAVISAGIGADISASMVSITRSYQFRKCVMIATIVFLSPYCSHPRFSACISLTLPLLLFQNRFQPWFSWFVLILVVVVGGRSSFLFLIEWKSSLHWFFSMGPRT